MLNLRLKKTIIFILTFIVGCVILGIMVAGCNYILDNTKDIELSVKIDLNYYPKK